MSNHGWDDGCWIVLVLDCEPILPLDFSFAASRAAPNRSTAGTPQPSLTDPKAIRP